MNQILVQLTLTAEKHGCLEYKLAHRYLPQLFFGKAVSHIAVMNETCEE